MKYLPAVDLVIAACCAVLACMAAGADVSAELPHVSKATALAGSDLTQPLFLCRPDGLDVVVKAMKEGTSQWVTPTRAFDNLFYVGNRFVGVWVVKTSAGLILFDATQSTEEARDHLVPGLRQLGLDPATIRDVIVTHAHWDHYGGAKYLHDTFGARIGLSAADWQLLAREAPGTLERRDRTPPEQDWVIADGEALKLGDTTIRLYVTPGHTPGAVSAIVPAREHGKVYPLSLLGSTAFPPTLEATDRTGGILGYERSVERFAKVSRHAGALGLLNTHIFADGTEQRLDAVPTRGAEAANPFVLGASVVERYYGILDECLKAAAERPAPAGEWSRPLQQSSNP